MYKKDIINFLFIISFSIFGIGSYVTSSISPSIGNLISSFPYLLIILFYLIDILYRREFKMQLNSTYFLMLFYILVLASSYLVALYKGHPLSSVSTVISNSIILILPFHAFIVLFLYNQNSNNSIVSLTLISFGLLFLVNLIGYFVLGLKNEGHYLEGRLNLPFMGGLYTASSIMTFMNLIFISQIIRLWSHPEKTVWWRFIPIGLSLILSFFINSRMSTLLFMLVTFLIIFRGIKSKMVFWISLFTIPIVLNINLLLYEILSIPLFASIMQRVDFEDITTFNGRSYLWERGIDWLLDDQRGLFFGNGYMGQTFLGTLHDIGMIWNPKNPDIMHFHSTTLEIAVDLGLLGLLIFLILIYKLFFFYRKKYSLRQESGDFFVAIVYLVFFMQIDTFLYNGMGFVILSLLITPLSLRFELKGEERDEPVKINYRKELEPT